MHRLILVLIFLSVAPVWAQDSEADPEAAVTEEAEEQDSAAEDDVDAESYVDTEEDDFRPSEEIPADQSIDFPTDI